MTFSNDTFETEDLKDAIINCESLDELREEVLPKLKSQKDQWRKKINEVIDKSGLSQEEFANRCKVSRQSVSKWCNKGAIPKKREQFIRIALASGCDIEYTNNLLQRYGRFPELYSKSLEDAICIFVIENVDPEKRWVEYDNILNTIKKVVLNEDGDESSDINTVNFNEKLSDVKTVSDLERFVFENVSVFAKAYNELYKYIEINIESNYLNPDFAESYANNIYDMAVVQGWSSSLRQAVSAIRQRKWYPTRDKIISLGLHLSMTNDQINEMLEIAHMKPLYAKNIFESVIMFLVEDQDLNDKLNKEKDKDDENQFDPDELIRYIREELKELDIPEVMDFISELPEDYDEKEK